MESHVVEDEVTSLIVRENIRDSSPRLLQSIIKRRPNDVTGVGMARLCKDSPEFRPVIGSKRMEGRIARNHRADELPLVGSLHQHGTNGILKNVPTGYGKGVLAALLGAQDVIMRLGLKFRRR